MTLAFTTAVLVLGLAGYYTAGAVRRHRREEAADRERCRAAAERLRVARALQEAAREDMPPRPPQHRPPAVQRAEWWGSGRREPGWDPCGSGPIGRQQ
jgi:hypothetical protein